MEPQLFSCGLNALSFHLFLSAPGFNGAATFQLRIVMTAPADSYTKILLQWSRNFSVADCNQDSDHYVIRKFASMEPQLFSCGLQYSMTLVALAVHQASMEPQLFSCGLVKTGRWVNYLGNRFNGAATFQLRIEDL